MDSSEDALTAKLRCFAYWCTNGVAHLGDNLDNAKYPNIVPVNMEGFLRAHKKEDVAIADQQLGF